MIEFIGQKKIVESLNILLKSSNIQNKVFPHCLFSGGPGLGKTTLANLVSKEIGRPLFEINAASLKDQFSILYILKDLKPRSIIFIDEIHNLKKTAQEALYTAMEGNYISLGEGDSDGCTKVRLSPFTLFGATTSTVSKPMLDRFAHNFQMVAYTEQEIENIIQAMDPDFPAATIAPYCRKNPRIARKRIGWVRDYCVSKDLVINKKNVKEAMEQIDILANGLTIDDISYLRALDQCKGKAGLTNLKTITGFSSEKIAEIEEYLQSMKYIMRTSSGRRLIDFSWKGLVTSGSHP